MTSTKICRMVPTQALLYFEEKLDAFISFLSSIKAVRENEIAFAKLPSFRAPNWVRDYCEMTREHYNRDKKSHLECLMLACGMKANLFEPHEVKRFGRYLDLFMEVAAVITEAERLSAEAEKLAAELQNKSR